MVAVMVGSQRDWYEIAPWTESISPMQLNTMRGWCRRSLGEEHVEWMHHWQARPRRQGPSGYAWRFRTRESQVFFWMTWGDISHG